MVSQDNEAALDAEVMTFASARLALEAAPLDRQGARVTFCKVWPAAREALTMLEMFVPASIRIIVGIVRGAGDAAARGVCQA